MFCPHWLIIAVQEEESLCILLLVQKKVGPLTQIMNGVKYNLSLEQVMALYIFLLKKIQAINVELLLLTLTSLMKPKVFMYFKIIMEILLPVGYILITQVEEYKVLLIGLQNQMRHGVLYLIHQGKMGIISISFILIIKEWIGSQLLP